MCACVGCDRGPLIITRYIAHVTSLILIITICHCDNDFYISLSVHNAHTSILHAYIRYIGIYLCLYMHHWTPIIRVLYLGISNYILFAHTMFEHQALSEIDWQMEQLYNKWNNKKKQNKTKTYQQTQWTEPFWNRCGYGFSTRVVHRVRAKAFQHNQINTPNTEIYKT